MGFSIFTRGTLNVYLLVMLTHEEARMVRSFSNWMLAHNRMRRAISTRRMGPDFLAAGKWEADNCPEWMRSKLYSKVG